MTSFGLTTSLLGIGLAACILLLIRRDHLYLSHGAFWLAVACVAAVLGIWPQLIDRVAVAVGISYPPTLMLLVAAIILFIKSLVTDITNTRLERNLRRLNQRLAMIESDIHRRP